MLTKRKLKEFASGFIFAWMWWREKEIDRAREQYRARESKREQGKASYRVRVVAKERHTKQKIALCSVNQT